LEDSQLGNQQAYVMAKGEWVTFGRENGTYYKNAMVRFGNPVSRWNGKWSKPVYVSGNFIANS